tara:strand:+ start:4201 stop:4383 length:183 start_codon:yes stop_codon:yes gene_type:complete
LSGPRNLAIKDNYLYVAEFLGNKISKYNSSTSNTNSYNKKCIKLHPNPAKDFLKISNLEK